MYPVPAKDYLTINVNSTVDSNFKLEIYNSVGKRMMEKKIYLNNGRRDIDLSGFSHGIYLIKLYKENGDQIFSQKFIKE